MINIKSVHLFTINENVICLKCGNKGAVQSYGKWHPKGLGNEVDKFESDYFKSMFEKYRDNAYMSRACGWGGTVPWKCMNCGNIGLIDFGGLECYKQAFETVKED